MSVYSGYPAACLKTSVAIVFKEGIWNYEVHFIRGSECSLRTIWCDKGIKIKIKIKIHTQSFTNNYYSD